MSELGPEARALLAGARGAASPTPEEAARLWGRVNDSIAKGAATGATTSTFGSKIVIAISVIAAIGVGTSLLARSRDSQPMVFASPHSDDPPALASFVRAETSAAIDAPVAPVAPAVAVDALPKAPAVRTIAASSASASDDDVALVRASYEALRRGDATRALILADEHARRFPKSALAQEREVTRSLAMCALGRRTCNPAEAPR